MAPSQWSTPATTSLSTVRSMGKKRTSLRDADVFLIGQNQVKKWLEWWWLASMAEVMKTPMLCSLFTMDFIKWNPIKRWSSSPTRWRKRNLQRVLSLYEHHSISNRTIQTITHKIPLSILDLGIFCVHVRWTLTHMLPSFFQSDLSLYPFTEELF